ncbi:GNAT family N-acetyltransferase [Luethyella okanaganae]|uniref:GNAT family N-acetyltransferase n=1 Tax=Luethyella okanaganae TaxID=69372 RepID=A0ABW1VAW2_9MICO
MPNTTAPQTALTASTPPFTVRPARADEFGVIVTVIENAFRAGPYGHLSVSAERRAFECDAAGRAESGTLLVAVDDADRVTGTVSLLRAGTRYARLARPGEAEVRLLAVDPATRGNAVGDALVRVSLECALEWGELAVVLDTGSENPAQRACTRLGFERLPERDPAVVVGGVQLLVFSYRLQQRDDVVVRLMRPEETDAVSLLSERAYSHDYELSDPYRASIMAVEDRALEHQVWVAEDAASGDLLGTVSTPHAGEAISDLARPGELDFRLLAVDPAVRRHGIGELLTRHVLGLARIRGLGSVVMNSGPEMTSAHRLYETLGFERMPDREPVLELGGHTVKLLSFRRPTS